ncbi:MAG TPA: glycerophosphodiester phosphodiesterase family protein [Dongiaceae bacterium]|jgi:glycerophosphoryl diester phosphodiesterase|nr:glycerophosphodiester phosphodiesterase family protein [Dongiaceae bacterium]
MTELTLSSETSAKVAPVLRPAPRGIAIDAGGHRVRLKWHRLQRRVDDLAFTPRRLREGLVLGASMEVDLRRHADHGFVCLHDATLERETTGSGPIAETTTETLRRLTLRRPDGSPSGEGLILLEDLAEIARMDGDRHALLQLDLKEDDAALDAGLVESFRRTLASIAGRCIISGHDWKAVSRLAAAVPGLRRGFDPCGEDTLDQLRDDRDCRAFIAAGLAAAPEAETIYLDYRIVLAALELGVDLIAPCHDAGKTVDAWTLDPDHPRAAESLWHLIALKADQITTDAPEALETLFESIEAPQRPPAGSASAPADTIGGI